MEITREQVLAFRVHAQELDSALPIRHRPTRRARPRGAGHRARRCPVGARAPRVRARPRRPVHRLDAARGTPRLPPLAGRRGRRGRWRRGPRPTPPSGSSTPPSPLKEAGIPVLDALDRIAGGDARHRGQPGGQGRDVDRAAPPAARALPALVPGVRGRAPLRAALPPRRAPGRPRAPARHLSPGPAAHHGLARPAKRVDPTLDPVRGVLRLLGPATPKQVAEYVDAPVKDVKARWPDDVVPVVVEGEERSILERRSRRAAAPRRTCPGWRRCSARSTCSCRPATGRSSCPRRRDRKDLWRTIGRPGGILVGHEVLGSWRPRASGKKLRVALNAWAPLPDLTEQAERLAAFRGGRRFDGFVERLGGCSALTTAPFVRRTAPGVSGSGPRRR